MQQIFCEKCGENHEFTPVQLEQLVHALQAELSQFLTGETTQEFEHSGFDCLKSTLDTNMDVELYNEWINQQIEARRFKQGGIEACEECGEDVANCTCEKPVTT